ncbi:MAG: PDZ domain-containing protein [Phycisphaerae bacterium]
MTRTRWCVILVLIACAAVAARPALAEGEKDEARSEVRVEMHAAGPGRDAEVRMWVNGQEVQPGDPAPAGVARLHAESIADPDAGMGGKGANVRTRTRIEVKPDQPGGQPRVRMWINGKEVDPGKAIQLGQGRARLRIESAPDGRRRDQEEADRAVLGVRIAELPEDAGRQVDVGAGVLVTGVVEGSPAEHVGLREGDVITHLSRRPVASPEDLVHAVGAVPPGTRATIHWRRPGAEIAATVALAGAEELGVQLGRAEADPESDRAPGAPEHALARPDEKDQIRPASREGVQAARAGRDDPEAKQPEERAARKRERREDREREDGDRKERERGDEARQGEAPRGGFLGVLAAPLNDDLREIAGTDKGVLINSLTDDSPAAKAGLKPGDVIVRIGDTNIESVDQLVEILGDRKPGDRIHVVTYRMGKRRETEVTLGRRPGEEGEAREPEGMPRFEDFFGGEMPNLREYLERLRPQMRDWARRFREQRDRPEMRPPEPSPQMEKRFDRLMERLDRIERRLDRIEERLERQER